MPEMEESPQQRQFFPCIEQPVRCYFSSVQNDKRLSSTKDGLVFASTKRSNQETFIVIPQENNTVLIQSFRDGRLLKCGAPQVLSTLSKEGEEEEIVFVDKPAATASSADVISSTEAPTINKENQKSGLWRRASKMLGTSTNDMQTEQAPPTNEDKEETSGRSSLWSRASQSLRNMAQPKQQDEKETSMAHTDGADTTEETGLWTRASKMMVERRMSTMSTAVSTTDNKDEASQWRLEKTTNGGFYLTCMNDDEKSYLACGEDGIIVLTDNNDEQTTWSVEFQTGELCFLSSPAMDRRVRCDLIGSLALSENWRGWEVWRFIEADGDGYVRISAWMHHNHYLCSNADGSVYTTTNPQQEDGTKWAVEQDPEGNGVTIRSALHERVLCCDNEKLFTDPHGGAFGIWQLEAAHRQRYSLSTVVDSKSIGPFPYVTDNKRQIDEWEVEKHGDSITFFSVERGQYLGSTSEGEACLTPFYGTEKTESWKMEARPNGGCSFRSTRHNRYLSWAESGENDGTLCTTLEGDGERESWRFEPVMPRAVSGGKIKTFAIGTAAAVATTVAMPFAVAGVVGLIGAEVGILADIVIVGLTSAEAIASVGVVGTTAALVFKASGDSYDGSNHGESTDDAPTNSFSKRPFAAIGSGKRVKQSDIL